MEGIDDNNWEDYNKKQIKRRVGQNVTVQEIKPCDVGRWVIDQNQLYTDVKNKGYKDPDFFKDKLRNEYNCVPYVPPKETNQQKKARQKFTAPQKEKPKESLKRQNRIFNPLEQMMMI
eukprot:11454999-Ditylum_brightwellii.AAC.1